MIFALSIFFPCYFQVFSVTLIFISLNVICLDVVLFAIILFGVARASSICKCISFTKLEDFQLLCLQIYIASVSFCLGFHLHIHQIVWYSFITALRLCWIFSLFFRLDYFYWSDFDLPDSSFLPSPICY